MHFSQSQDVRILCRAIQVAVAIFTSIGSRIPKNLFPGDRSFTVIEFEQYKLDELKARHCLFMFFVVVFLKFNLTEITDEVLSKEKGWFPRHCVVRIDEEESASKKDD